MTPKLWPWLLAIIMSSGNFYPMMEDDTLHTAPQISEQWWDDLSFMEKEFLIVACILPAPLLHDFLSEHPDIFKLFFTKNYVNKEGIIKKCLHEYVQQYIKKTYE